MSKTYAEYDIENLVYGETWQLTFAYKDKDMLPVPLMGKRLYGEFRSGKSRAAPLVITIDSNESTIVIVDAVLGLFNIAFTAAEMLSFSKGKGKWDLWLIDGTFRDLLVCGNWIAEEAVSNWPGFIP